MRKKNPLFISAGALVLFAFCSANAHANMAWQPVLKKDHHGHSRMAAKQLQLTEHSDSEVMLWQPDLKVQQLTAQQNQFSVRPSGMDNYHALIAEFRNDQQVNAAIRYEYLRGKPSGQSPSRLTSAIKTDLEIIPAPLPREHRRYHANHDAVFLVRYEDQLLSNTEVTLTTSNGTQLHGKTDRNGAVRFTLPDDFATTKPGRRANRPAEFILSSQYQDKGISYHTTLSAAYHVDPAHWQSFELGLAVIGLGFVAGMGITRRGHKAKTSLGKK